MSGLYDYSRPTQVRQFKRCAFYGRYSTSMQRPASIEDQERMCRDFAAGEEWAYLDDHRYIDCAVSGTSTHGRKAYEALSDALGKGEFDYVLVDDTSRLSRKLSDILLFTELADHFGVGVRFISQRLDSTDPQFKTILQLYAMFDAQYVERLGKKVFSAQRGRVIAGFHCGSIAYGYRGVTVGDESNPNAIGRAASLGTKLEVIEAEAIVIRRIHANFADGWAKQKIATSLNQERVSSPHPPRENPASSSWTVDAIDSILRNEKYIGWNVWNVSHQKEHPVTGKITKEFKPASEHIRINLPNLQIITNDTWGRVQARLTELEDKQLSRRVGGYNRSQAQPYLYSGLLICGLCRERMKIGGVQGKGKYECRNHRMRRGCPNALSIREDRVSKHITDVISKQLVHPDYLDALISSVWVQLRQAWETQQKSVSRDEIPLLEQTRNEIQAKIENLLDAIEGGQAVSHRLESRNFELEGIQKKIAIAKGRKTLRISRDELENRVRENVRRLQDVMNADVQLARTFVIKHVRNFFLYPGETDHGPTFVVIGELDLFNEPCENDAVLLGCDGTVTPEQHTDHWYRFYLEIYPDQEIACHLVEPLYRLLAANSQLSTLHLKPGEWANLVRPFVKSESGKVGSGVLGRCLNVHREILSEKFEIVKVKAAANPGHLYRITLRALSDRSPLSTMRECRWNLAMTPSPPMDG